MSIRVGYHFGYWKEGPPRQLRATLNELSDRGCTSIWTSEAYGPDAFTPLAWAAAADSRMRLGTAVAQISARSAATTATTAMTLDHLSSGRFALGLGVSGPDVVEGWHGATFEHPLTRTREYVQTIRSVWARTTAPGLPRIKTTLRPFRASIPLYIGAEGPKNIALAAEIADGLVATHFSVANVRYYTDAIDIGRRQRIRSTALSPADPFELIVRIPVVVDRDIERAADRVRPRLAREVGLMGPHGHNFHYRAMARLGFQRECEVIRQRCASGDLDGASAAVPLRLAESVCLLGPVQKIIDDLQAWRSTPVTEVVVGGCSAAVEVVAEGLR